MVQMRFLRLHSVTAVQKVTYSCHPGHRLGLKDQDVKFLSDSRRQSFLGVLKDCVVCPDVLYIQTSGLESSECFYGRFR